MRVAEPHASSVPRVRCPDIHLPPKLCVDYCLDMFSPFWFTAMIMHPVHRAPPNGIDGRARAEPLPPQPRMLYPDINHRMLRSNPESTATAFVDTADDGAVTTDHAPTTATTFALWRRGSHHSE